MDLRQDLAQAIGDLGTYVTLDPDGEARTVYIPDRPDSIPAPLFLSICRLHLHNARLPERSLW